MRRLTISSLVRTSGQVCRQRTTRTAQLRLAGRWLEAAGFRQGARVQVQISAGVLVITTEGAA